MQLQAFLKKCRVENSYFHTLSLDIYAQLILMHSSLSNRVVVTSSVLLILCVDVINPFV